MVDAYVSGIAHYLPNAVETVDEVQREHPDWNVHAVAQKVGITQRHLAAEDECASDLAVRAAERLLESTGVPTTEIDYVILCTQTPDYFLPTTACLIQHRLGLATACGALDINLGCSGYIYGLSLSKALIASDQANTVLLITADTYSKFIHPDDRTVRMLFGDGAAATLVTRRPGRFRLRRSKFGTDGSGAENLIVSTGGLRNPVFPLASGTEDAPPLAKAPQLFMNGPEVLTFSLRRVPEVVGQLLAAESLTADQVDRFVFHQANRFMLERIAIKMKLPSEKVLLELEDCGNTVSSSIPITLSRALEKGQMDGAELVLLAGFGVGYSWGATLLESYGGHTE